MHDKSTNDSTIQIHLNWNPLPQWSLVLGIPPLRLYRLVSTPLIRLRRCLHLIGETRRVTNSELRWKHIENLKTVSSTKSAMARRVVDNDSHLYFFVRGCPQLTSFSNKVWLFVHHETATARLFYVLHLTDFQSDITYNRYPSRYSCQAIRRNSQTLYALLSFHASNPPGPVLSFVGACMQFC